MHATGYPTSPACMISATAIPITYDRPIGELDDDPIETTIIGIQQRLASYPYKYRITLPTNSPRPTAYSSLQATKLPGHPTSPRTTSRPTSPTISVNISYNRSLPSSGPAPHPPYPLATHAPSTTLHSPASLLHNAPDTCEPQHNTPYTNSSPQMNTDSLMTLQPRQLTSAHQHKLSSKQSAPSNLPPPRAMSDKRAQLLHHHRG